ncbi:hypothetical protein [Egbenema bharatensis]|uniref:hypothetical protein n=1 Tax=Egbenema bharatensis TaxID=3463334 RepID=UPI003A879E22
MKYTLNFSLKLDRDDHHCIVYDKGGFTENPIAISIPEIVKALEHFITVFEEVGVVEEPSSKNDSAHTKKKANEGDIGQKESVDSMQTAKSTVLKGISGKAYICQSKELNEEALARICSDLTSYFQECYSKISTENFLSDDNNSYISGIREVLEIRNYLAKYTRSKKKSYQNGYLYISAL